MLWENKVDRILLDERMGEVVNRIYGTTADGQNFAIVLSQALWYAVRVIVGNAIIERHEFFTRNKAEEFCEKKHRDLMLGIAQQ